MIARPTYQENYVNRANDLDMHLEEQVRKLVLDAVEAGWSREEVFSSFGRLCKSPRWLNVERFDRRQ